MAGSAVSEGLCAHNRGRIAKSPKTIEECVAVGLQAFETAIAEVIEMGRLIQGSDMDKHDEMPSLIEKAIRLGIEQDPLKAHEIVAAEQEFPDFGNLRPDVISRDPMQELGVTDYKCKFSDITDKYVDKNFHDYFDGEQRLIYTTVAGASVFGIAMIVLKPFVFKGKTKQYLEPHVQYRTSRVRPNEVKLWRNDYSLHCRDMELVEQLPSPWMVPGKVAPHANQYGDCPFREACVEDNLDPDKMKVRYLQLERTKDATPRNETR